jgi:hypothetical protein
MSANKLLSDFDPHTVSQGTVIWCKGSSSVDLTTFLDILAQRKLDLYYVGPKDRYVVRGSNVG